MRCGTARCVCSTDSEMAIQRGDRLNEMEDKSETLMNDADKFNTSSRAVRQMFCRRHARMIAIAVLIVAIIILIIIVSSLNK